MNNFIEPSYCRLLLGSWAGGNYGDEFYYPSHRILLPAGLASVQCYNQVQSYNPVPCVVPLHVSGFKDALLSTQLALSSTVRPSLNFHPKHVPQGLSVRSFIL